MFNLKHVQTVFQKGLKIGRQNLGGLLVIASVMILILFQNCGVKKAADQAVAPVSEQLKASGTLTKSGTTVIDSDAQLAEETQIILGSKNWINEVKRGIK